MSEERNRFGFTEPEMKRLNMVLGLICGVIILTFAILYLFDFITFNEVTEQKNELPIEWKKVDIESSTAFYPEKEIRLFSMEDSYQFDEDTWLCVGDCVHPLRQVPFVDQCNMMSGTAYFNSKGEGIICDLPQQSVKVGNS